MTGPLEPTSEAYAMAKLGGPGAVPRLSRGSTARSFITAIPANPFGPGDDFALRRRARRRRADRAGCTRRSCAATPEVVVWGTRRARREFLFVDDLADALPVR